MPDLPKTVSDVMTKKVVTIGENDTLEKLEEGMQRFHFRHLPVVEDGKLVGLVSHRDLLHAFSSFLSASASERDAVIRKQPAKKIMRADVVTIGPDDTLLDAAKLMWEAKLGCLPVVDKDEKLVGILTEGDFVRIMIRLMGGAATPPPAPSSVGH